MQLNGEQRELFHKSLLSAFPSKSKLEQMVSFKLDQNLSAIAMGEDLSDTVLKLIIWAEAEGKVEKFLSAARKSNPGNLELRSFEAQMLDKFDEIPKSVIPENLKIQENSQSVIPENPKIQENDLISDKGVDYSLLKYLLKAGKWKEADKETYKVMLKAAGREQEGWLNSDSVKKIPCTDLRTIDQLWVKYSNGHFGFSVQKRIWKSVGENYEKLGYRVGWRGGMWLDKKWLNYNKLTFCETVPQGYLPLNVWIGRGWELWHGWFDDSVNGLFLLSRKDL